MSKPGEKTVMVADLSMPYTIAVFTVFASEEMSFINVLAAGQWRKDDAGNWVNPAHIVRVRKAGE